MTTLDVLKARIGKTSFSHLENEAEKEVGLAMQMPLLGENREQKFYEQRPLIGDLLDECEFFEKIGLKISPTDVVKILFRCKLLFAVRNEQEYSQRRGSVSLFDEFVAVAQWSDRSDNVEVLVDRYLTQLEARIAERTLLTHIDSFRSARPEDSPQQFFNDLFTTLFPFVCFFDGDHLIEEHKHVEPGLRSYDRDGARRFFCAPSIGFKVSGSREYCFWYSSIWLRTFLNVLRIASYLHPGQRDFGRDVKMTAPTYPVFLGAHAQGVLRWDEDKKESWAKIPDGCLFLSHGYRGLSNMWLDPRSYPGIKKLFVSCKKIFDSMANPWNARSKNDIAPMLDILSSATQIPDLGAKILLLYCSLEHLFVPKDAYVENKKYIVGGMHALGPHLIPWFNRLYNLRCAYAHKGFVLRDEETMALVTDSMKNVMILLVAKLSVT
jgi:hypothetical protein